MLWAIFLYLIRGLFFWIGNQIAEFFGWTETEAFLRSLEPSVSDKEIIETFFWYLVVIVIQTAVLVIWAVSNQVRFRGRERRRTIRAVDIEDLGALYEFPPAEIAHWQGSRSLVMYHDQTGKLVETQVSEGF